MIEEFEKFKYQILFNKSYCVRIKLKQAFIGHHFNLALVAHLVKVRSTHGDKLRVQIISEGLQKLLNFMPVYLVCLNLLFDWRGGQC